MGIVEKKRMWLPKEPEASYVIKGFDMATDRLTVESETKTPYDYDLSKRNFNKLIEKFGNDTDKWIGKEIRIMTEFDVAKNQNSRTIL